MGRERGRAVEGDAVDKGGCRKEGGWRREGAMF